MLELDEEKRPYRPMQRSTGGPRNDVFFVEEGTPFFASNAGAFIEDVVLDIAQRAKSSIYLDEEHLGALWHEDYEEIAPIDVPPTKYVSATMKITSVKVGAFDPAVLPDPWEITDDD